MPSSARRDLLKVAFGGVAAAALGIPGIRSPVAFAQSNGTNVGSSADGVRALGNDLHVLTVGGTNIVAMTNTAGALLVDGGSAAQSATLAQMIAGLPGGGAVRTLFNTCWHPTQTGSNETLGRAGASIIAQENTSRWLTADITWPWDGQQFKSLPEVARPNKTFFRKDELVIGDQQIEYGHVRACPHTDGDSYVFFRDANVLAAGESMCGAGWPSIDWWTGGWLGGIVGAMELFLVLADDETRIVPARGRLLGRADVEAQHEMYDLIYERLVELLYAGKSPDEAVAAKPIAEFESKFGSSDEFVRRAFQSLWGYLTPDA